MRSNCRNTGRGLSNSVQKVKRRQPGQGGAIGQEVVAPWQASCRSALMQLPFEVSKFTVCMYYGGFYFGVYPYSALKRHFGAPADFFKIIHGTQYALVILRIEDILRPAGVLLPLHDAIFQILRQFGIALAGGCGFFDLAFDAAEAPLDLTVL